MSEKLLKSAIAPLQKALSAVDAKPARAMLKTVMDESVEIRMCHPFGDLVGPAAFFDHCLAPLLSAMPDLERRDMIVVGGTTPEGSDWIGCMGNFMGTLVAPFLDIPPTGRLAHMRYHEFFRIEHGRIVEMQAIWDIAVAETRADQVLLIERESNTLATTLSAPGMPIALTCLGRCLMVLCREPKSLLFFDLASTYLPLVAEWDLSGLGDDFCNVTTMHVDPRGGSVFLRSPFHPRFPDNAPGVKRVWEPAGETLRFCWSDPRSGR